MKPIVLFSLVFSLSALSSQFVMADLKGNFTNINNSSINMQKQTESWLGVWIENIPMALGNHLLSVLKKDQGVLVRKISPESPADKADIQVNDIIAKINDQEIFSQQQFTQLIQSTAPDTKIELGLVRQGKLMTQEVVIEARPRTRSMSNKFNQHSQFPFSHPGFQKQFSHPIMNDSFFQSHFGKNFKKKFDDDMSQLRQQMNQLQQQFNQEFNYQSNHQANKKDQAKNWFQFESIQIESTGDNKHRAEVKYSDSEGTKKEFIFEGKLEEIKAQIIAQKNMDETKKEQLLQALNLNNRQ